ncbi:MAG: hypothetical protein KTR25_15970 [Myxococcales bacterium]|nr:hypothetical protein [Myxococcales bacterium]
MVEAPALGDSDIRALDTGSLGPDETTKDEKVGLSSTTLADEPEALPESAYIDSPQTSTRDLLMSALDVVNGGHYQDKPHQPTTVSNRHQKPYIFLESPSLRPDRRASARFPLAIQGHLIRIRGKKEPIRVTSGSAHAFFACSQHPLETATLVIVEMSMLGSYRLRVPAQVVRTTDRGFAVQLDPDPRTISYRAAFLELARQANLLSPSIRIEVTGQPEKTPETVGALEPDELESAWSLVLDNVDDDEVHQSFIHTCMRAQNIEFAVARYRKQSDQGQRFAEKYLEQLGTILGFYNMVVRDDIPDTDEYTTGRVKAFLMLAFAILITVGAARWLSRGPMPTVAKPHTEEHHGGGIIHLNIDLAEGEH